MSVNNRIWLHTRNGVITDIEKADFEIPQIKEVYSWLNNKKGDIHIFENEEVMDHKNYEGIKIAYLRESPAIYDYTSQHGTPHIHKWAIEREKEFDYFFSCFDYIKDIVGEERYRYVPVGGSRIQLKNLGYMKKKEIYQL